MSITIKSHSENKTLVLNRALKANNDARNYVPDLSAFISLCDANYVKFMKLIPDFTSTNSRLFGLSRNQHELGLVSIEIVERSPYTTTMNVKQGIDAKLIPATSMQVRLYHDASMAEVLSYQGRAHLRSTYAYPNQQMYQKDEKVLCNEFLADWLSYCLKFGYSLNEYATNPSGSSAAASKKIKQENIKGIKNIENIKSIKEDNHK